MEPVVAAQGPAADLGVGAERAVGIVGIASLLFALNRLKGRRRWFLLGIGAAAVVGLLGGFELLQKRR